VHGPEDTAHRVEDELPAEGDPPLDTGHVWELV
jgi:hypothetical protein